MPEPAPLIPTEHHTCPCGRVFAKRWQLSRHIDVDHDGQAPTARETPLPRVVGRLADAIAAQQTRDEAPAVLDLDAYRNDQDGYSCPCGRHYSARGYFYRHLVEVHAGLPPPPPIRVIEVEEEEEVAPAPRVKHGPRIQIDRQETPLDHTLRFVKMGKCPGCHRRLDQHTRCGNCTMWTCRRGECKYCELEQEEAERFFARMPARPLPLRKAS
jgi:hypothetical protein